MTMRKTLLDDLVDQINQLKPDENVSSDLNAKYNEIVKEVMKQKEIMDNARAKIKDHYKGEINRINAENSRHLAEVRAQYEAQVQRMQESQQEIRNALRDFSAAESELRSKYSQSE